jgi:phasin family protein
MADASQVWTDWVRAVESLDMTDETRKLLLAMAKLKIPGVDMDMLVASQLRNLAALGESNRAVLEGVKAVGKWQTELLQVTMDQLAAATAARAKVTSLQQIGATEAELAKTALETAIREMQELANIVTEANRHAVEAIAERVPKSLEDIQKILKSPTAPSSP